MSTCQRYCKNNSGSGWEAESTNWSMWQYSVPFLWFHSDQKVSSVKLGLPIDEPPVSFMVIIMPLRAFSGMCPGCPGCYGTGVGELSTLPARTTRLDSQSKQVQRPPRSHQTCLPSYKEGCQCWPCQSHGTLVRFSCLSSDWVGVWHK